MHFGANSNVGIPLGESTRLHSVTTFQSEVFGGRAAEESAVSDTAEHVPEEGGSFRNKSRRMSKSALYQTRTGGRVHPPENIWDKSFGVNLLENKCITKCMGTMCPQIHTRDVFTNTYSRK